MKKLLFLGISLSYISLWLVCSNQENYKNFSCGTLGLIKQSENPEDICIQQAVTLIMKFCTEGTKSVNSTLVQTVLHDLGSFRSTYDQQHKYRYVRHTLIQNDLEKIHKLCEDQNTQYSCFIVDPKIEVLTPAVDQYIMQATKLATRFHADPEGMLDSTLVNITLDKLFEYNKHYAKALQYRHLNYAVLISDLQNIQNYYKN